MKLYILFLVSMNILLSLNSLPLSPKRNSFAEVGKSLPPYFEYRNPATWKRRGSVRRKPTPPPIPPRHESPVKKNIPPLLPLKRYRYNNEGQKVNGKYQSKEYYTVKSYTAGGMILYECNHITFLNQVEAQRYCRIINNNKESNNRKYLWKYTPIIPNRRNSFSQPNSGLMYRNNSISGPNNFPIRRTNSLLELSGPLPGLSRSVSRQSLTRSNNDLPS
uniref:Si:dkey-2n12.1 protein (inferred by orthology to a zebrafish protein) n=1 Tax=Strongyloides venezuelensis TaxID=75913 RepID=A0A0K0FCZ7_STRVS